MNRTTEMNGPTVSPEEVERRIAEYRRVAWEHRAPAQVVYHPAHQGCPWPNCGQRIRGIRFQLEDMGTPVDQARWLAAWWQGPGLVGRCPGCGHFMLFGLREKQPLPDTGTLDQAALPDDWHQIAYIVP